MSVSFDEHVLAVKAAFERLQNCAPIKIGSLPQSLPSRAIYVLREEDTPVYVGRSNRLRERLRGHCSGKHEKAALAFRLARQATGRAPTYTPAGSRQQLALEPEFMEALRGATERIRRMSMQFVEEPDPVRQTLLEVYAAVTLGTPYNNFDNH